MLLPICLYETGDESGRRTKAPGATPLWLKITGMATTVKANGLTPAKEVQKQALDHLDGKIVKVSLCQTGGVYQYELVYLNGAGQVVTQAVDAKTPFPQ